MEKNLLAAVKNREFVAGDKRCGHGGPSDRIDVVETVAAARLRGKNVELVGRRISWADCEKKHAVAFSLHQSHRANGRLERGGALEAGERHVGGRVDVVAPEIAVLDVEQVAAVLQVCGALALEFEDEEAAVVTGGDEVNLGVRGEDPEAVLAAVGEKVRALGGIPHSDGFVLAVAVKGLRIEGVRIEIRLPDDEVVLWQEKHAADVVRVAAHRVDFPRLAATSGAQPARACRARHLAVAHSPQLDEAIVSARHYKRLHTMSQFCSAGRQRERTMVGWKAAQFTPRSWPSRTCEARHCRNISRSGREGRLTCLTTASLVPNKSEVTLALLSEGSGGGCKRGCSTPARPVEASAAAAALGVQRLKAGVRLERDRRVESHTWMSHTRTL